MFIGILTYHGYLRIVNKRWFISIKTAFLAKMPIRGERMVWTKENTPPNVVQDLPTTGEFREPLLDENQ